MSKTIEAFISSSGSVYRKIENENGQIQYKRDGEFVNSQSFAGGKANLKHQGQPANVAIPDDDVPQGYRRVRVPRIEASQIGKQLRLSRDDIPDDPRDTVLIDGEEYDTAEIVELNRRIVARFGPDAVMKYSV